jgi:hypothetical protein
MLTASVMIHMHRESKKTALAGSRSQNLYIMYGVSGIDPGNRGLGLRSRDRFRGPGSDARLVGQSFGR